MNVKKKNKLRIYTDSYGHDIPRLLSETNVGTAVYGEVRPSAKVNEVLKNCVRDCADLGPQDCAVIIDEANDIDRNETKDCINTLKITLMALTCSNVIVLNIPTRHDLIKESIENK
jgi:hypothetical protein